MAEVTTQTKGARLIRRRHPDYSDKVSEWDFWLQSYKGGKAYINSNLFKYFKEGNKEFQSRQKRAYRENHSKRIVDLINSYLFKEQAKRKANNAQIIQEIKIGIFGVVSGRAI